MSCDEMIVTTLSHSKLAEDLSPTQLEVLAELAHVRRYVLHNGELRMDGNILQDALMILVEGEIAINGTVDKEHVVLNLAHQGDMARILSFVGGNVTIAATLTVKRDSTVLLIKRAELEALLLPSPMLAYLVMRNLVRHMHSVARRSNTEKEELSNYMYHMNGRY